MATQKRNLYHEQIANTLRREILSSCAVGQTLPSDAEQARRFDVSVITLREALRLLSREGLLERRQGSRTRVRSITPRPKRVALLTPPNLASAPYYFHNRLLQMAVQQLKAKGLDTETIIEQPTTQSGVEEESLSGLLARPRDRAVDAVLRFQGPRDRQAILALEAAGIPVVGHDENLYLYSVRADHARLIREAVAHLIAQGRRRIAFMQHEPPSLKAVGEEWFLKVHFREALAKAGVPYHPEWVCTARDPFATGSGWDHIHDLWQGDGEKPDAVLVGVDTLFTETAMALLTLGVRVPQDVLVVTHANKGSGMFYPFPVVRLEIDPEACAAAMVDVLVRRLRGETDVPKETCVPFAWVGVQEME